MSEPVRIAFSEDELRMLAIKFMRSMSNVPPNEMNQEARYIYYTELGLLSHFITELYAFPSELRQSIK